MNPCRIITFDVAHGNCHAIWSPSGKLVVIDLGTSDDFSPITWLKAQGHTTIDFLLITHPHDDHLRGFRDINGMKVKILHRPRNVPDALLAELDADLRAQWNSYNTGFTANVNPADNFYDPSSAAFDGMALQFFGGSSDSANLNNYSIVTVLNYAGLKIILPGDLECQGWAALLQQPAFKAAIYGAQILVASHHGREAGWCPELFDHVAPMLVVVSDGSCTQTSWVSRYCDKASGAKVTSRNTNETRERYVISTRDNGHIDINASFPNQNWAFTASVTHH